MMRSATAGGCWAGCQFAIGWLFTRSRQPRPCPLLHVCVLTRSPARCLLHRFPWRLDVPGGTLRSMLYSRVLGDCIGWVLGIHGSTDFRAEGSVCPRDLAF
jgi:hypothetical protein